MDVLHDALQFFVYFFLTPAQLDRVLSHFQTWYWYTTCIGCLTRSVKNLRILEYADCFWSRRHVGSFWYSKYAVCYQCFSIVTVDFILSGRRKSDVCFFIPWTSTCYILATVFFCIFTDTSAIEVLQFHDVIQFFAVDTVRIIDVTVRVGHGNYFSTQLNQFFYSILCYVSWTRYQTSLTLDVDVTSFQHFQQEIDVTVTCSFRTDKWTTKFTAFTSQHTAEFASQFFVHTEHVTYFTAAYTYITGRNVSFRTDVAPQFQHECLAETHYFCIWLTAWREVRSTFTTTHRKSSQWVLEGLFECQELQNSQVYRAVETDTAFVRADSVVVLYTVTHVGLDVTFVVHPSDAELVYAIWNTQTFNQVYFVEFRVFVVFLFDSS